MCAEAPFRSERRLYLFVMLNALPKDSCSFFNCNQREAGSPTKKYGSNRADPYNHCPAERVALSGSLSLYTIYIRFSGKSQSFSKKAKNKEASHSVYAPPANLPASCAMYALHNYCMRKPGKSQWFFGNPSDIYYNIILAQKKKPERR